MASIRNLCNRSAVSLIVCCCLMALAEWGPIRADGGGFDLNEMPETNEGNQEQAAKPAAAKTAPSVAAKRASVAKKMTPEFYAKVQKLMSVLAICNRPTTEFYKIEIPNDFSAERKAMMALEKLGKSNLILKKDYHQYNRIMSNCRRVAEAVNAKTESMMSVDSQYSGGTWEERVKRIQESMKLSVLDNFRERLSGGSTPTNPAKTPSSITTTPAPPQAQAGLGLRIESPKSSPTAKVSYFNFF